MRFYERMPKWAKARALFLFSSGHRQGVSQDFSPLAEALAEQALTGLKRRVRQTIPGPAKQMSAASRRSCCRARASLRRAIASPKELTALRGTSKSNGRAGHACE